MPSGANPAAVSVSRNGPLRSFQVGTLRPCLSLPSPVSTTMRRLPASSTSEWIVIFRRPSSMAKCGISQGSFWISSLVASGRIKRVEPTVSSSTTLVILTLPTFHCIRCFPVWRHFGPQDAGFDCSAQWINRADSALSLCREEEPAMPELTISPEKVAFLIEKAREFDVKEGNSDPDSGSNGSDDEMIDVLEDNGRDPVQRELAGFIDALTEDEQVDLIALMRLGRGDGTIEEWKDLRREAAEGRRRGQTASYLLGEPMLGDLLAEGLGELGVSWDDERTTPVQ